MINPSRQSDADDRSGRSPQAPPAVPGWVKVFGLVALVGQRELAQPRRHHE